MGLVQELDHFYRKTPDEDLSQIHKQEQQHVAFANSIREKKFNCNSSNVEEELQILRSMCDRRRSVGNAMEVCYVVL